MCDLENCDPNDLLRPSVSPTDRRLFLAGAIALPLATILANVDLAEAQAAKGVSIKQTTADGRTVSAYFAEADKKNAPVVILIHEWWGLNDDIKTMAEDIRARGFHTIAIDLLTGRLPPIVMRLRPKPMLLKPVNPMQRSPHGLIAQLWFLPIKVAFRDCFRHILRRLSKWMAAAVSKWFGKTHDDSLRQRRDQTRI